MPAKRFKYEVFSYSCIKHLDLSVPSERPLLAQSGLSLAPVSVNKYWTEQP